MLKEDFLALFEDSIRRNWNRTAFSDYQSGDYSYGETAKIILVFHEFFKRSGIKPGDKIAVCGRNCSRWATVFLAAVTHGAVAVPILSDFHPDDIHHIVNHSESRLFFVSREICDKIDEEKMPDLEGVFSLEDFNLFCHRDKSLRSVFKKAREKVEESSLAAEGFRFSRRLENSDLAALIYTSGTTGFSKGVMLNCNSLLANILYARSAMKLDPGDRMLSFLPLAHSYACAFDFLFPFTSGCHITFLGKVPSPKILLEAFAAVRPRLVFFVPLIMEKLYKKRIGPLLKKPAVRFLFRLPRLSDLLKKKIRESLTEAFGGNFKEIVIGGAALNREVEEFLKSIRFPFSVGYGMTECGPLISYAPWDVNPPGAVGKPIGYLELRIDSADPHRDAGEIMVRGENVMLGYYKNEEATGEVLDNDGWLHTGDLGLVDEEGFVYIKGRRKDLILGPSGQNIYPEEVESKLNALPFVQESLVLADEGAVTALIYPDWEAVDAERGSRGDSEEWLAGRMEENRLEINSKLPGYIRVSRIFLQAEPFEKTPTQKIKRYLYRLPPRP